MSAGLMTFGAFLQANSRRRPPLRRRLALLLSLGAHAGVLLAAVFLRVTAPACPAPPPPEPIVLRLPRLGRPPAQPAPPPPAPRPPRRAPRPAAIVQPPPVLEPPPPSEPLEPEPDPEPVAEPSAPDEALGSSPAEGPAGPPGAASGTPGPPGDSDRALELRDVARAPQVLAQVQPEYPREARWNRLQGLVVVRVVIGTDGRVERSKTRVVRSIPELDAAAIAAIEQWRFSPAIGHSGQPVRVVIEVPVRFSLR